MQNAKREHWSSQWLFVMATIGASVGLANIWRFPYTTGENGGGAFVLIYLTAVVFMALPLLIGELLLGRRGQDSPPRGLRALAREAGASARWAWLGYLGVGTALLILSYYCLIGGETLIYAVKNLAGQFSGIAAAESSAVAAAYNASFWQVLFGHSLFLGATVVISARGINHGLEKAVQVLMPTLFLLLLGMVVYAGVTGDFGATLAYLFVPDFDRISAGVVIEAFGQAFFSIGVGVTILMAYGSYLERERSVSGAALVVVSADTLVALLAGLAVFPVVFASGLDAGAGPSLVFETMPLAFGGMPGGRLFGTLFFLLLGFAALSSTLCILEAPVAALASLKGWSRRRASWSAGAAAWLLGLLPVLSLNHWQEVRPLAIFGVEAGFFELFDYAATNILLPVGGLFTALFVGWVLRETVLREELRELSPAAYRILRLLLRYFVPLAVALVFINLVL